MIGKEITIGGITATYLPHEEKLMRELALPGREVLVIHELKALDPYAVITKGDELVAEIKAEQTSLEVGGPQGVKAYEEGR